MIIEKMVERLFLRLSIVGLVGLFFFLMWKGWKFANAFSFIYGFSVIMLDFLILARFSSSVVKKRSIKKTIAYGGMFFRYFVVFSFLYFGIRVAPKFIFAIISGAVWANLAFTIVITLLLKERSGWSMEEHNSSHGR
ncbi:ATP synthase subunit I [Desulfurobacterium sp.]